MVTIAFHNGSAVRRAHNIRNEKVVGKQPHIDPNGVHEVWHDEPERKAYARLFGDAVKKYNEKQLREERRIADYYSKIKNDKQKHTSYEAIVGIYGEDCSADTGREILSEFFEGWAKRNPSLELIGCYYHADEEGGPHLHIDYIPVAHGYQNGMECQTSMSKALEQMGYRKEGRQTAQIAWEASERNFLEKLCREHGLVVYHPGTREHLDTDTYKSQRDSERMTKAKMEEPDLQEKDVPLFHGKVAVDRSALEEIRSQATEYRLHQSDTTIRAQSRMLREREKKAKALEKSAQEEMRMVENYKNEAAASKEKEAAAQERIRNEQRTNWMLNDIIDILVEIIADLFKALRDMIRNGLVSQSVADKLEEKMEKAEEEVLEATGRTVWGREQDDFER